MSPEQLSAGAIDSRSDIFGLGCVLYEMVTGNRAFIRGTPAETLAAILRDAPDDLPASGRTVPAALASVVRRCLEKNPDQRFQSARDLSFALKEILAASEAVVPVRAKAWRSDSAIAAVAVVLLAAGAWFAFRARTPGRAADGLSIRSIAVLPLSNVSGDSAQEYLADGVTEQLIADLARVGDLRVISRTSSMTYKGAKKRLSDIARELAVDAVVEGSIVRSAGRVKITASLIDAQSDKQIWANTFERDVKDVLTMQREIARSVARSIHVELTPTAEKHLTEERAVDPQSFDSLIRGRYAFNNGSREDLFAAVEYFQKALDADPTNADAYSGLAEAYAQIGYFNYAPPLDVFPKAKAAASRALEIDASSAEAHATLGYIHLYFDWDFQGADSEFRKAIELDPSLASAHRYYSIYLAAMLRPDEATREASAARTLDPLSVGVATDSGFVMYYDRAYDKATKALQDAISMNPKAAGPHFWLGRVYQAQKMYGQATAEYKAAGPGLSQWPPALAGLGHMYGLTGRRAEAMQVLHEIDAMGAKGYVSPYCSALIYLGLGDRDKTLALLQRSFDERANWMVWLLKDPRWDPMRSDPRFQGMIRHVGFPQDAQARQPHTAA